MKRKHEGQFCDKTIVKGKKVKVLIEKLDLSKYLKHLNSTEPHQIKISDDDEADPKIKIEKSEDIKSTIDHEYKYETQDSTLTDNLESGDCDLISKIEIEEDLVIKKESSDLSEFIEQCHKEDISTKIRTESEFIEPDEEMMNPVTIEEFFPQWNTNKFDQN